MKDFVSTSSLKQIIGVGKSTLYELRLHKKLLEGVHYIRVPGGRKLLWNLELVRDYFVTGGGNTHQRAIESYLYSLPSNQPKKVGRKNTR
jgi:hypothetical protein